jgi:hypothetical protein
MRVIVTLLLSILSLSAQAQLWIENFEYPRDFNRSDFIIDTADHSNPWQVGRPHKAVFDSVSAYSLPNVIITDTLNPFPPSDTSVFTIQYHSFFFSSWLFSLNFSYKLDIDSGDIAKIEISGDRGLNWIDPLTEDTAYQFYWGAIKPRFDTSAHLWQSFQLNMYKWVNAYPGGPDTFAHYRISDTLLFRFTFISDTDTISNDGWMMDNFFIQAGFTEGNVGQVINNDLINIYPVPSKGNLYFHIPGLNNDKGDIVIYNMAGREVFRSKDASGSGVLALPLPDGNYVLKYASGDSYAVKRFIISR